VFLKLRRCMGAASCSSEAGARLVSLSPIKAQDRAVMGNNVRLKISEYESIRRSIGEARIFRALQGPFEASASVPRMEAPGPLYPMALGETKSKGRYRISNARSQEYDGDDLSKGREGRAR
jgi:hypothetical protein